MLPVDDGALGFWAGLSEVYPQIRTQRCWMHKTGNVLNYLPKSGHAKAKQGLYEIWMAETSSKTECAFDDWLQRYDDKYPKATACLARDRDELLVFYNFSLRTGRTFEPPTSSNRPSPPSATEPLEPKAASRVRPCCR